MNDFILYDQENVKELVDILANIPLSDWKQRIDETVDFYPRYYIVYNDTEIVLRPRALAWRPYLLIDGLQIIDKSDTLDELSCKIIENYKQLEEERKTQRQIESVKTFQEVLVKIKK